MKGLEIYSIPFFKSKLKMSVYGLKKFSQIRWKSNQEDGYDTYFSKEFGNKKNQFGQPLQLKIVFGPIQVDFFLVF